MVRVGRLPTNHLGTDVGIDACIGTDNRMVDDFLRVGREDFPCQRVIAVFGDTDNISNISNALVGSGGKR